MPIYITPVPAATSDPCVRTECIRLSVSDKGPTMKLSYRDRLAAYLRDHEGQWVDGLELARIAGAYAWRTRLSECRRVLHMTIENRERKTPSGVTKSEYRYTPPAQPKQARLEMHP